MVSTVKGILWTVAAIFPSLKCCLRVSRHVFHHQTPSPSANRLHSWSMVMLIEVAVILCLLCYILKTYTETKRMPPGPFPLPLIGNLHQIGFNPPFTLDKLWRTYGDVYWVTFPIRACVVVNSGELAREALVRRKDDFAGRPTELMYPVNVILEGKDIATADYDQTLIFRRKLLKTALRAFGTKFAKYRIDGAVGELMGQIGATEGKPFSLKSYVPAVIVGQLWEGISSRKYSLGEPTLKSLVDIIETISSLTSEGNCYQLFPFLRHFTAKFTDRLRETMKMRDEIFGSEVEAHQQSYQHGVIRDVTDAFLAAYDQGGARDGKTDTTVDIIHLMMNVLFGASATTTAVITWFGLYVARDSALQRELQRELDLVVGRDRLPSWTDVDRLPLLQSTVYEVMRHSSFMPFLIPHKTIRDTTIQDYHLPKNTPVFFNLYRIYRDPAVWEQPMLFKPGRFLDAGGKFALDSSKIAALMPFGVGFRSCPGKELGRLQVFVMASCLLHQFTIELPNEERTRTLDDALPGAIRYPKDYRMIATKR